MKILALSASPHPHGNSAHLVDELLAGAREVGAQTERLDINAMSIKGCQGDYACKRFGKCGVKDDMQTIYQKIDEADAVVFASPVYMLNINAQLKTVMDRLFHYMNMDLSSRINPPKRSALIVTQGQPDAELFKPYLSAIPQILGMLGFGETHMLLGEGLRAPDEATKRPDLQARAREIGKQLATA
jgi:multimeric flavodoxin WrbA